jgi:hypothetical protein
MGSCQLTLEIRLVRSTGLRLVVCNSLGLISMGKSTRFCTLHLSLDSGCCYIGRKMDDLAAREHRRVPVVDGEHSDPGYWLPDRFGDLARGSEMVESLQRQRCTGSAAFRLARGERRLRIGGPDRQYARVVGPDEGRGEPEKPKISCMSA